MAVGLRRVKVPARKRFAASYGKVGAAQSTFRSLKDVDAFVLGDSMAWGPDGHERQGPAQGNTYKIGDNLLVI